MHTVSYLRHKWIEVVSLVFEVELNHAGYPKQVFFNTTNAENMHWFYLNNLVLPHIHWWIYPWRSIIIFLWSWSYFSVSGLLCSSIVSMWPWPHDEGPSPGPNLGSESNLHQRISTQRLRSHKSKVWDIVVNINWSKLSLINLLYNEFGI